ncbi:hypothetical protein M011DRAFT_68347 [Sporormia fimetaria CBS 119925]|uniref:Uncharacterized protein n=1 Tax=Sporormia fimetaria CBS 119925 TaxID=1340428 RepID=A0A6A6V8K1_9PLEO|nr:hypothetical protein M011DRAFT_68347 [Sporormia fimetaria CBS 119925]
MRHGCFGARGMRKGFQGLKRWQWLLVRYSSLVLCILRYNRTTIAHLVQWRLEKRGLRKRNFCPFRSASYFMSAYHTCTSECDLLGPCGIPIS